MMLRHAVTEVVALLMDVHIHLSIVEGQRQREPPRPVLLVGRTGGRIKCCAAARLRMLEKLVQRFGSDQVMASALGSHHGSAAVMRAVRNRMYFDMVRQRLSGDGGASAVSVNMGGGSHGGSEVLVGTMLVCSSGEAVYLRPAASFNNIEFLSCIE